MATITQTKLVGFGFGNKANYNATTYANHIWFDPTNKQILLNGIEYIPKKLSELVNDKNFLTSITKSMVEGVLTGNITSHTHTFASLTSKPTTLSGYGITDAALSSDLGKYLPLTGGTLSGNLTCNGSYIQMNGDSGAKGYKGYFNQSGTSNRASGSHVFMGDGQALGSNAISLGYNAFAGIRNQDADKGTYPYIAWQWMPSVKVNFTINNQGTANGEFYGYEVLGGKMVQYEIGGNTYTYENTSTSVRVLVCVKDDADTGLIFGGKSYMPYNATKTLISGKYMLARGESITNVNTITVGDVNYYVLAIYTWSATVGFDYSTQVKVMCATKVNNSDYNGASSYASGSYSVASGSSSVASGSSSVASGSYSVASGLYSVASGLYSVASGYSSVASGLYSVASGYSSVASGSSSVASGDSSVASGSYSVASGYYSVASGYSSVASGSSSVASGSSSVASGAKAKATHYSSFVSGYRCTSGTYFQTVIGRTNVPTSDAFIIGNGSSDHVSDANAVQSNCFAVDWSGNVTAKYFSGYAHAIGNEGIKVYATNSNEINFGGTSSARKIYFGYSSLDSRPTPTTYNFGNGTATIQAASFTGNASTATALTSSAGSATQPVYFSGGKPVACTYTLGKSVPSDAVFTDTTYSVATASADGLMSTAMFKAQMVKSVGVRQGGTAVIGGGTITNHSVYITQKKSNITNAYQQAIGENDVTIPNATKDYDGSMSYTDKRKLDKMPNTVFGLRLDIDDASTVSYADPFGDYNICYEDASISDVNTIQTNNHYITLIAFDITNDELKNKLKNSFVKFGYSSKDSATYQTMRLLQSNFDGGYLFIEYIHTEPQYYVSFDCIWELY